MIRGSIMAQTRSALHRWLPASPRIGSASRGRAVLGALCAVFVAFAAGGCTYRMNVQQGNVVEMEDLNQVREGMTRSQVQFLLGTPMISDPFHSDRWDYTYSFREGRRRNVTRHWVTIYFDEDRVVRIETHIPPPGGQNTEVASRGN
jgi:outer membrane protein assembly factor BamE